MGRFEYVRELRGGPRVGLTQRLLITAIAGWLILAAHRVRAIAAAEATETPSKRP